MAITEKRKTGDLGEDVAVMFLMKQGFSIIERNYLRKWGEIDIIAKKAGKLYFVEVKTVSCGTRDDVTRETAQSKLREIFYEMFLTGARGFTIKEVIPASANHPSPEATAGQGALVGKHETRSNRHSDSFRPEDNLHTRKLQRLRRTIQTYLAEKGIGEESDWQFDAMCVYLDEKGKYAEVECIKDIIL
jgi:Holliday junction resolvase-like predicted endonuclease